VSRVRRILRWLGWTMLVLVVFVAVVVVATALTAPGRDGLPGAAQRAREWEVQPPLRDLADRIGVRFGAADMASDLRNDPQYGPVLAREFNSLTPFVEMKWGTIHPEPRRYDFTQADELVGFATTHHMRVRGHTLVYGHVVDLDAAALRGARCEGRDHGTERLHADAAAPADSRLHVRRSDGVAAASRRVRRGDARLPVRAGLPGCDGVDLHRPLSDHH
jgi:hypothetical protein